MMKVFVYCTLMNGKKNHSSYLSNSKLLGIAEIADFAMYSVSSFPGIVPQQDEKVKGEVYAIDEYTLRKLDMLEGEGSLYIRKMVDIELGLERVQGYVYIWNSSIKAVQKVNYASQPWKEDSITKYIWYACYGSNLLKERFMLYVQGGYSKFNKKNYYPCTAPSTPLDDKPVNIPYKLYFGNTSQSWFGGGVAFLDSKKDEAAITLGRMYLISEEQFFEINKQEGQGWYNHVLNLGSMNGVPIKTFTHSKPFEERLPTDLYLKVMEEGIRETYPNLSKEKLNNYLKLIVNNRCNTAV